MSDSVSLVVQSRSVQRYINTIQTDMIRRGNEVSTGKIENLTEALGGEIRNYLDLNSTHSALENRQQRLETGESRLNQMGIALEMVHTQTQSYDDLFAQIGIVDRNVIDTYIGLAESTLDATASAMNTQWGGRYLFSGDSVQTRTTEGFDALQIAVDNIITANAVAAGGTFTTQAQIDTLLAEIDTVFDDTHPASTFGALAYTGGSGDMAGIEVSEGSVMSFDIKGDDLVFRETVKGMILMATQDTFRGLLPETTARNPTELERDYVKTALTTIINAGTLIINEQSNIGFKQERVNNTLEGLESVIFQYEERIGLFENADPYEAGIAYSELQRQLEASYFVTASLADQSLLNFLR
ncbi:MAG: flagellin [Pseudomonadota bacterium]